jgi:hypothetical protein
MVNNSININNTNSHILPQAIEHKQDHEFQVLTWDRHNKVAALNWLIGPQPFSSL